MLRSARRRQLSEAGTQGATREAGEEARGKQGRIAESLVNHVRGSRVSLGAL